MCGIFGGIGDYDPAVIRTLALLNMSRGRDSVGFFTHNRMFKSVGDSMDVLKSTQFNRWLAAIEDNPNRWFLCGHTRLGTRGQATKRNAHPFKCGKYVGIHNGVIDAPFEYEVDSEYLWELLAAFNGDYQTAWEDVVGYWGLAWTDSEHLFLQSYDQEVNVVDCGKAIYFSSEDDHLTIATGMSSDKIESLNTGETWKFLKDGSIEELTPFYKKPEAARDYSIYNWRSQTNGTRNYSYVHEDEDEYLIGGYLQNKNATTDTSTLSLEVEDLEKQFEELIAEYE